MSHAPPDWYREKRLRVEAHFRAAFATETKHYPSPSGRYGVDVTRYATGPATWAYARGSIFREGERAPIAVIDRNFGAFPLSWCEGHPNGHDYLLGGEDYQGQTVVELDTGERVDHIDPQARDGMGFCWAAHFPSPAGDLLFVDGCFWAAPYELVLFDFREPMQLPYPELGRWPVDRTHGWQQDGSFVFEHTLTIRRSDGTPLRDLSDDERDAIELADDYRERVDERSYRARWRRDAPLEVEALGPPR